MSRKNILILAASGRNGLATAGALLGSKYHLIGMDEMPRTRVIQFIRKICKLAVFDEFIYFPRYTQKEIPQFILELEKFIKSHKIDILLPTGTHYTLIVSEYKQRLSRSCIVPFENFEKMGFLHDKYNTMKLCESLGIPIPRTLLVEDQKTLEKIKNEIEYPSILKARKGSGTNAVWVVRNSEELQKIYMENIVDDLSDNTDTRDVSRPMIQEFIPGELHDVTSFSVNGNPKAVLSQVRVMTSPLWGGVGVVNETTDNPEIKEIAIKIIQEVKWDGILMFDFKIDSRDGKAKLIEINPKIWGTTWLTVQAGLNMPLYLVKHSLSEPYEIPDRYEVGLCARWPLHEMDTWLDKPVSVKVFIERVFRFLKMFGDQKMVYDFQLLGLRGLSGVLLCTLLAKIVHLTRVVRKMA